MPLRKPPPPADPAWKAHDKLANKDGLRTTVHAVNGATYTGEWRGNTKQGKGSEVNAKTGRVYEGDFEGGLREGYGVESVQQSASSEARKIYAGGWKAGKRHGHGDMFYKDGAHYEGEWYCGERSGWGRVEYANGDMYEGEWLENKRSGRGMLVLASGNRYEGMWLNDMKHGDGKYFYLDKGQCYAGTWAEDSARCGEMTDLEREHAHDATPYALPACTLADPAAVLASARGEL